MARALVTGASGFIAQQLILDLLEQGHEVRGTVRSAARGGALKEGLGAHSDRASAIELVEADLETDAGWADAVAGVDVVHHLASPFPMGVPKDPEELIQRRSRLSLARAWRDPGERDLAWIEQKPGVLVKPRPIQQGAVGTQGRRLDNTGEARHLLPGHGGEKAACQRGRRIGIAPLLDALVEPLEVDVAGERKTEVVGIRRKEDE